jgi:FAD/FMN-containing dehydrogenase
LKRKRITIARKSRKIGFLGKGMAVPSRESSEVVHALELRIDEDLISTDKADLESRRYDAEPVPAILGKVFSRVPRIIVFPNSATCLADIIDTCIEERTPASPRGAGTSGLGGAIPVRGGVVIDLTRMSQVVSIDKPKRTVTVEAGCTWQALEEELAEEGLCLQSYPSGALLSTVGGWMSTGGYGIGTLREGRFHNQVEAMEVALPSGLLVTSSPGEGRYGIATFAGTEGQMGAIAKLTLPVRDLPETEATYLIPVGGLSAAADTLRQMANMDRPPLSVALVSGVNREAAAVGGGPGIHGGPFILVHEEGDSGGIRKLADVVKRGACAAGAEVDDGHIAAEVWKDQGTLPTPGNGGSVCLAGEVLVDIDALAELLARIGRNTREAEDLGYVCQLVDRTRVLVRVGCVRGEAGQNRLFRDIGLTNRVVDVGLSVGGQPYGVGIWNTCYAGRALGSDYKRLKRLKDEIDRLGILNPGKVFSLRTNLGLPVFGWMYRAAVRLTGKR